MPEVNPEIYRDVGPLLFRGFLVQDAEINGVHFVFKSLNQHEFDMVRWLGGVPGKAGSSRFWNTFIAYSVFVVEGTNILAVRDKWVPKLRDMAGDIPIALRDRVVRYLGELNRRASSATTLVEAYGMEAGSRFRWAQVQGADLTSPAITGIPGTEQLGYNWGQLLWKAINHFEDMNVRVERDWENAKFVGSCFAGKGIQRVYNQDHNRRRQEVEDKIARRDRVLRHVVEGLSLEDTATLRDGRVMIVPKTVEELAAQMERDLRGEKDWHDRVVEEHERRVREKVAQQQQTARELAERHAVDFGGRNVLGGTPLVGLTPAEAKERAQRSRQYAAQALQRVLASPEHNERVQAHLERWGLKENEQPLVEPREVGPAGRKV